MRLLSGGKAARFGLIVFLAAAAPSLASDRAAERSPSRMVVGTAVVRWLSILEAMLEAKAQAMRSPRKATARVIICFHVDPAGRVSNRDLCRKSGSDDADRFALDVLSAAGPFPPPPPSAPTSLAWTYKFGGPPSLRFH